MAKERLIEYQDINRQWHGYMRDIYQLRKRVPCPIAGRETFREPRMATGYSDPHIGLEYMRLYRDQVYDNAEKGNVPCRI